MSLGTGALKVSGEGAWGIQAPQGGFHGNPESGNHPIPSGLGTGGSRRTEPLNPPKETPSTTKPIGWTSNQIMAERNKKKAYLEMQEWELLTATWRATQSWHRHASFCEREDSAADGVLM